MTASTDFNADWAAMKAEYAAAEAAAERAAYQAKADRDDALLWAGGIDRWTLETLRDGKAYRDANPAGTPAERAEYAELDRWLAVAEATYATRGGTVVTPTAAEEPAPARPAAAGVGRRLDPPTSKQVWLINKLCDDLGRPADDRPAAADKRDASRIIDALKAQVTHARRTGAARPAGQVRPATERQVEFVANLLTERAHAYGELDPAGLTAARASELITELLAAPRAKVAAHGIAEGRYAYTPDGGATADHYRVTRDGRIVVWTAGGEWPYNGKLNAGLEWIKANQRDAAILFGRLTETCGRCGRPLSDDDSRKRGLGPVCAEKAW